MRRQSIENVHTIVIHHSASRRDVTAVDIRRWHMDPNKPGGAFADIGYHLVVEEDGGLVRGRTLDTVPSAQGGRNTGTWAICIVGDNTVSGRHWLGGQISAAAEAIDWLRWLRGEQIPTKGHRDVAHPQRPTLCPGIDIKTIRELA